jgi:hypothetical protein
MNGQMANRTEISIALVAAAIVAYLPAVNNGFIADDFVILARLDLLKSNPLYLLQVAPENFRLTTYIVFAFLKTTFGPDYHAFYIFNILLHAANVLLLKRLVGLITNNEMLAWTSAALFAVFQAPQEAVTWLAAMNETLLGFFVLWTLIFWERHKYGWAVAAYSAALFSKESAPIVLLILPLIQVQRGKPPFPRQYRLLLIPTAVFAAVFAYTLRTNFMIGHGTYALGLHALIVLANSVHRLLWPWAYIVIILSRIANGRWPEPRQIVLCAGWVAVLMLPYIFVTYTIDIPSRQLYLASAVLVCAMAAGLVQLDRKALRLVFLTSFVAFNIAYLWIRKDAQMEERAAPTTALIQTLKTQAPSHTLITHFPYPYPEIAKAAALLAPGWNPDEIEVNDDPNACKGCLVLDWVGAKREYAVRPASGQTPPSLP